MLLDINQSALLIIDIQEKLTPLVAGNEQLVSNCRWLGQVAMDMQVPVFLSEQYPAGLGSTIGAVKEVLGETAVHEKVHFSCFGDDSCRANLQDLDRKQLVVCGIEAHVCILQTVLQSLDTGFEVFVVVDAVSSRSLVDKDAGMARMQAAGATVVTREMVLFEWLRKAGTEQFKHMSKTYLR